MKSFRLKPILDRIQDANWAASFICETVWVRAEDSNEARAFVAGATLQFTEPLVGKKGGLVSPWLTTDLTDCSEAEHIRLEAGVVLRSSGEKIAVPGYLPQPRRGIGSGSFTLKGFPAPPHGRASGAFGDAAFGEVPFGGGDAEPHVPPAVTATYSDEPHVDDPIDLKRASEVAVHFAIATKNVAETLRLERKNDPNAAGLIDFLEMLSKGLERIAAAIENTLANGGAATETQLNEVQSLCGNLAKSVREYALRNHDRIFDFSGSLMFTLLGASLFVTTIGMSPNEAVATQLVLLGLSKR